MSDIIERARALREKIEALAAENLSEEEATEYPELFPKWEEGREYKAGERVRLGETLYKVLQDHSSQADWIPDEAASLFSKVLVEKDEEGEQTSIPEWEQPDSTNPYSKGDKVTYEGSTYESLIDNNVWSPADYPLGWNKIAGDSDTAEDLASTLLDKLKGVTEK